MDARVQTLPRPLARRMAGIAPFHVMELLARAQVLESAGRDVVHMEVGEPDFPTPAPIVAAGQAALAAGRTRYTAAAGIAPLREAIAGHYAARYGVDVPAQRVLVTAGASAALQLAIGVLVNPGDRVLMADPTYPCNRHFVRAVDGEAVCLPVGPETDYQLTPELVDAHWDERTVAVLLASPSNPTGTLVTAEALAGILAVAERRGGRVIVDEIYHGLIYGPEATTALAQSDQLFVVNSFSKYFGMTGWRLGWLVAPEAYLRDVEKLAGNLFLAPSTPAQYAALAAFSEATREICEQRREAFQARRDFLLAGLRGLGLEIPRVPDGAFYLYTDCGRFTDDSYAFAFRMLDQVGVAAAPGIDFGSYRAATHLRFAYTNALPRLEQGLERIGRLLSHC